MPTVVLVDDSRPIREFCRRELERDGYRVLCCAGGDQALRLISRERPDVVVLDVRLPGLDGPEVARRARNRGYLGPLVFHTGAPDAIADLLQALCAACVEKSEDLSALRAAISAGLAHVDREGREAAPGHPCACPVAKGEGPR